MRSNTDEELLDILRSLEKKQHNPIDRDEMRSLASEAIARSLQSPPPDGQLQPWARRIFANLVTDRFRRLRTENANRFAAAPMSAVPDPEQQLLCAEEQQAVKRALAELPHESLAPIVMHYFEDQDYGEIAEALACARPTVRTRIHRTFGKLRDKLGGLRAWFMPVGFVLKAAPIAVFAVVVTTTPTMSPSEVSIASTLPPRLSMDLPELTMALAINDEATAAPTRVESRGTERPLPEKKTASAVSRFDFENDFVVGQLQAPDEVIVTGDNAAPQSSLIEIPSSFVSEMVKTLENL